jgi:hypothetical protein
MYKLTVEIPESAGWFAGDGPVKPQNLDYCIILDRYGDKTPTIAQWIEAENYWVDMSEAFLLNNNGNLDDWEPGFYTPNVVEIWKPLGLPPDVDAQLKKTVRLWFEEVEE